MAKIEIPIHFDDESKQLMQDVLDLGEKIAAGSAELRRLRLLSYIGAVLAVVALVLSVLGV